MHQKDDGRVHTVYLTHPRTHPTLSLIPLTPSLTPLTHSLTSLPHSLHCLQVMEEIYPSTPLHDQLMQQGHLHASITFAACLPHALPLLVHNALARLPCQPSGWPKKKE